MSSNDLVEQIMAQVIAKVSSPTPATSPTVTHPKRETAMAEKSCSLTEFVGTAIGDTVGLVIANVDSALLDAMKLEKRYRSIGILGARTGAGPHIMAADEAVKATNTEVISIELALLAPLRQARTRPKPLLTTASACWRLAIPSISARIRVRKRFRSS